MEKKFIYHDVYGYCSELQYLSLEEKLRDMRK
jgi:hypothetical protein